MRFLVDVQLPELIARVLISAGHEAWHVRELADPTTPDWDIWALAARENLIVISKDEDFADLSQRRGGEVGVVWLRCGNTPNGALIKLIERHLPPIVETMSDRPGLLVVE